eukprot:7203255-Alexandrium_andersonii.AAC.1
MSASLVGSEMCIRDRVSAPSLLPTPVCLKRLYCRGELDSGMLICAGVRPVSYTHLTLPTICSV